MACLLVSVSTDRHADKRYTATDRAIWLVARDVELCSFGDKVSTRGFISSKETL